MYEGQTEEHQKLFTYNQIGIVLFITFIAGVAARRKDSDRQEAEDLPKRRQNTPMMALSSTTLRSASRASSSPPATAKPLTAAISGLDSSRREGPWRRSAQLKKEKKMC